MAPTSPDPRLDALAAAGRRRRRAAARAQADAAQRARSAEETELEARRRRADALRSYTSLRSLSAAPLVALVFGVISGMWLFGGGLAIVMSVAMGAGFPLWVVIVALAFLVPGLLALAWTLRARRRDVEFRAARPYAVVGYQRSLDYGRSYPVTDFEIVFAGRPPALATLTDVFATLPAKTVVEAVEGSIVRCEVSGRGSKFDGHRRWLPRWFYPACTEVFDLVHRSHPIVELRFPGY